MFSSSHHKSYPASEFPFIIEFSYSLLRLGDFEKDTLAKHHELGICASTFHELVCRPPVLTNPAHGYQVAGMPDDPWHDKVVQVYLASAFFLEARSQGSHEAAQILDGSFNAAIGV